MLHKMKQLVLTGFPLSPLCFLMQEWHKFYLVKIDISKCQGCVPSAGIQCLGAAFLSNFLSCLKCCYFGVWFCFSGLQANLFHHIDILTNFT